MAVTGEKIEYHDFAQNKYLQSEIFCYTKEGYLLYNADVSAYQAQAVVAPLYLWLILIGIGFFTGVFF